MSLILEALRKSEAERRRGQVPGLHAGPVPGAPALRQGSPAWLWPALVVAAVVVLMLAMWLGRRAPPPSPAVEVPVAAATQDPARSADGASAPAAPPVDPAGFSTQPDPGDSAGALHPPEPTPARLPDPAPSPAAGPAAAASTPLPSAPAHDGGSATPVAAEPQVPASPRPPPAPAVAAARPPAPATAPADDAVVPDGAAAPPVAAPLRLSDLTVAQRQQLPPLKVSMHMYSPTQRFAIVDGTRVGPGDRIGPAVVAEITATGVVLDWQGQRLHLPIR